MWDVCVGLWGLCGMCVVVCGIVLDVCLWDLRGMCVVVCGDCAVCVSVKTPLSLHTPVLPLPLGAIRVKYT